jgi:hypothetical protein
MRAEWQPSLEWWGALGIIIDVRFTADICINKNKKKAILILSAFNYKHWWHKAADFQKLQIIFTFFCVMKVKLLPSSSSSSQTSRIGPFDPSPLQSYNFSRQRFFGLPIVLLPFGLQWYDFKGIRFGGILCKRKIQFRLYSSILSSIHSVCSSRRTESFVLCS